MNTRSRKKLKRMSGFVMVALEKEPLLLPRRGKRERSSFVTVVLQKQPLLLIEFSSVSRKKYKATFQIEQKMLFQFLCSIAFVANTTLLFALPDALLPIERVLLQISAFGITLALLGSTFQIRLCAYASHYLFAITLLFGTLFFQSFAALSLLFTTLVCTLSTRLYCKRCLFLDHSDQMKFLPDLPFGLYNFLFLLLILHVFFKFLRNLEWINIYFPV